MAIIHLPKQFHPDFAVPLQKPRVPVVIDYDAPGAHGLVVVELFNQRISSPYPLELFDGAVLHGNLVGDGTTTASAVLQNLLEEEYPGTGDFTIYLDVDAPKTIIATNNNRELFNDYETGAVPTNHMGNIFVRSNGTNWSLRGGGILNIIQDSGFNQAPGARLRILIIKRNSVVYGYLNGVLVASAANTEDFFNRKNYVDNCHFGTGATARTSALSDYRSFGYWRAALSTPPRTFDINQVLKPAESQVYFTAFGAPPAPTVHPLHYHRMMR